MSFALQHGQIVREVQERAARGLPAEHVEYVSGWWLRYSASSSWWMSAVLPHGGSGHDDLLGLIATSERFSGARNMLPRFQISPGACARELDSLLDAQGYRRHSPMSLQAARACDVRRKTGAAGLRAPSGRTVGVHAAASLEWLVVWDAVHGGDSGTHAEGQVLGRVRQPSVYVCVLERGRVVSVGRAVADSGWSGVFGLATLPEARGQGAARDVLGVLAEWSIRQGAHTMYLQVEVSPSRARQRVRMSLVWQSGLWGAVFVPLPHQTTTTRSQHAVGRIRPRQWFIALMCVVV